MTHSLYLSTLISSLGFIGFFVWYLASDTVNSRRIAGLGVILASLLTCVLSLMPKDAIKYGIDLHGGTEFLLEIQGNPTPQQLEQASSVMRKRLDIFGTSELSIQPEGTDRLKIQIPGLEGEKVKEYKKILTQAAHLEFRMVPANYDEILADAPRNKDGVPEISYQFAKDYQILPVLEKNAKGEDEKSWLAVSRVVSIAGGHLNEAWLSFGQLGQPQVNFQLDGVGAKQMAEMCQNFPGRRMAIILDNVIRSAPTLPKDPAHYITTGSGEISGANMSKMECQELASVMKNPLENEVKVLSQSTIDSSLGADQIKSGFNAGIIALILVISFMVIYYRLSGLIAVAALAVNLVLLFGLLAQFHFTLTLPGIAGIVLTIGMAVDANVLIYERIRDELALGKNARSSIDTGFEKAFSAIFDSNITTLIPAVVLAYLGTGPLRGFAITLVLGIVANLFAALVVSRNCFDWILSGTEKPNLSMMQFIKSPKFDFLKYRGVGLTLSLLILIGGVLAVNQKGTALLGIDFKGGDSVTLTYAERIDVGTLRETLLQNGVKEVTLQYAPQYGPMSQKALLLETQIGRGDEAAKILKAKFPQAGFNAGAAQEVGARVGNEMKDKALMALFAGLFGILVYAAIRFEWAYAIAAAVGQLHDVLIALSVMAVLGRELTLPLVGALLTIAGYSINDKIVVFDRIREGARLREKGNFYEIINRSLNLTLARTILTGGTCLLATGALIIFGGPVIHDFSLAMFIGIVSGIYSSHFISPGLAWLLGRKAHAAAPANPELVEKTSGKKTPVTA